MNRTGAPAYCWLLTLQYVCYILNHICTGSLGGQVPLQVLYGVTPDISIMLLYTFYQPIFYATHDQHFPSDSEERAGYWVGFAEHCGDSLTHKVLDAETLKIIHRSALRPRTLKNPNKRLVDVGGEEDHQPHEKPTKHPTSDPSDTPTVYIKSRHDDGPISSKPLPEFNPEDVVGRTFLLPPGDNGERLRAKVTRKVVEDIEKADGERVQKLSYILGIGNGKVEELISYNQLVDHLEAAANEDNEINDDLFKFRALIGHQGPLKPTDPNWKGCKFNVLVEWETGEKTYEPLSILAADDPVTCATYAKENDLLHIEVTEVWILQGMYPLKDEWVFGCSLKTRLADQTKTQQPKWLWSKDSMNSTINQRLVEQTQEMNCKLECSGGSTLDDTLRKQYLSSSDE